MAINSKTKEQLEKQLKLFFKHQKEIWKISEDKTKEILWVLSENDNITKRKEDIRDSLLWVLSKEEIDQLYWEYKEYYKSQIKKFRDALKKYKLFPDKYAFLLNDFIYQILKDNDYDLEWLNKEIEETSEDDVHQFRERVKANIVALETLFPDRKVLLKFKWEIFLSDNTDDLISIITALKEVWIKKIYNITYLVDLIQYWYPEKIKENILTLEEIWINVNANFDKLYNIILKWEKENILTIWLLWINKADDIIKFENLIR